MRALYDIDKEILSCIDMETGEIIDSKKLDDLQMERKAKIEGVALWKKETAMQVKSLRAIVAEYKAKLKSAEKREQDLKEWLINALHGNEMRTDKVNIYYRSSERVDISCEVSSLPPEYVKRKTELSPDKELLKKALKNGNNICGVSLVTGKSIIIQ